ncbi:MAG: DHHA1 domain-containing protein [Pseudomonadota bacterium]
MTRVSRRTYRQVDFDSLLASGLPPVLARIYAARGIRSPRQLEYGLAGLAPFEQLKNATRMAQLLADAIAAGKRLLIVADYDSDGATACAVAIRALRSFGATVDYLVPNRFEYGYGLTPEIVHLAAARRPDILVTVDNGIASVAGVAEAKRLGIEVLVTDHHLPGDELPDAACIVNPNQDAGKQQERMKAEGGRMNIPCEADNIQPSSFRLHPSQNPCEADKLPPSAFILPPSQTPCEADNVHPSSFRLQPYQNLAGVGVIFYVMLALRAELRARGAFAEKDEPNLGQLLDLVALGTVADVVGLDDNNRILVSQGLKRIRAGRACPGIRALMRVAGREQSKASTWDLGFALGPRLNAAGRLDDMALGIECLLADDENHALELAQRLDALNRERRAIEADMHDAALAALEEIEPAESYSLCLYDPLWHQGVIGILASRLKDRFHRPVIAFAGSGEGELKGSGRSIPGLHLRDALDRVAKRHPDMLQKFGGHAMAAGLSLAKTDFPAFAAAFEEIARELLAPAMLAREIETDGALAPEDITLETASLLRDQVWGQGFPEPGFHGEFEVESQRIVGEKHLRLRLGQGGRRFDAMLFFRSEPLPERVSAVYRLDVNEYNGARSLQLVIEHWE